MTIIPGLMSLSYHLAWEHSHMTWPQHLEKTIAYGLRSVEWCGPCFADPDRFDPQVIEQLQHRARAHGIACQVAGWAPLAAQGEDVRQDYRHLEVQPEAMRLFGARVLRMGNTWDPSIRINVPRPLPVVAGNLKRIVELAECAGVIIALEDHLDFHLEEFLYLLQVIDSPYPQVTLDTGNLLPV